MTTITKNEDELVKCVERLSRVLVEHIMVEAARLEVRKEDLCPCWDVEVANSLKLMEKYRGGDDGEGQAGSNGAD
jgi:hypothetical protein